jgi:hypothetical protein
VLGVGFWVSGIGKPEVRPKKAEIEKNGNNL